VPKSEREGNNSHFQKYAENKVCCRKRRKGSLEKRKRENSNLNGNSSTDWKKKKKSSNSRQKVKRNWS